MIWKQNHDITNDYVGELAQAYNVEPLLVRIMLNRNYSEEFIRLSLKDMHEAIIPAERLVNGQAVADRITYHINNDSNIYIYADYDVDGLNSGFIMNEVISEIIEAVNSKATVNVYYPERIDGYGLSKHFAEDLVNTVTNKDKALVITVDNGIAQVEQINHLINNGIEVVVTDHHQNQAQVPNCLICDPHNSFTEQDDTFKHLCGAGVAFKVCELLQKNYNYHDMYRFVVNVAIATITDVMPLNEENIAFINYGMSLINSNNCSMGIYTLKEYLGIKTINPANIAWDIGPRLNACGRMGNTKLGAKLLKETDYDKCVDLVNEIDLLNEERKAHTATAKEQALKMDFSNDFICIVKLEKVPEGIVGIIAGQLAEQFNKPTVVVTEHNGECKGSVRSALGIDLQALFNQPEVSKLLIGFGGHAEAAGISFYSEMIEPLKDILNSILIDVIQSVEIENDTTETEPILLIDECISIKDLNSSVFDLINTIPYNKDTLFKPVFALTDCKVKDFVPTKTNPDNLWLTVNQGKDTVKLWCKDMTQLYKKINTPDKIHLAGYIEKNFMAGRPITLKVIDIIPA